MDEAAERQRLIDTLALYTEWLLDRWVPMPPYSRERGGLEQYAHTIAEEYVTEQEEAAEDAKGIGL